MKGWPWVGLLILFAVTLRSDQMESPSIQEVKKKHEARLMALPGVVSVGIGRDRDGAHSIIIGLDGPRPETEAQLPRQ